MCAGCSMVADSSPNRIYSAAIRCAACRKGWQAWEALDGARAVVEREINSANDNPLVDPESGQIYRAGNFYGGVLRGCWIR